MKKIKISYFAILREARGQKEEVVLTQAPTARALYEELKIKHAFPLHENQLKVAINNAYVDWLTPVEENDEVVFIPPVAGGA